MTIEEKRKAIEEKRKAIEAHCAAMEDHGMCANCVLRPIVGQRNCFSPADDPSVDADVETNYAILFPDGHPVDPEPITDALDHPGHYNREGAMECIEEMLLLFGCEETMIFCKLNAWKYRYRAADKGGMDDLQKSDRYLAKYKELKERAK